MPDDVFEAGEKKPQKKSGKGANGKKRAAAEVNPSYACIMSKRRYMHPLSWRGNCTDIFI
jgi:hypothetical protein